MKTSYVYFVQAGTNGPIKIGITKHNPRMRMVKIQSDCPYPIHLIGAIEGGLACERGFHKRLANGIGLGVLLAGDRNRAA